GRIRADARQPDACPGAGPGKAPRCEDARPLAGFHEARGPQRINDMAYVRRGKTTMFMLLILGLWDRRAVVPRIAYLGARSGVEARRQLAALKGEPATPPADGAIPVRQVPARRLRPLVYDRTAGQARSGLWC